MTDDEALAPRRAVSRHGRVLLWCAAWALAAVLLWLAARGADWASASSTATDADIRLLTLAVVSNLGILALWAALWRMLLPDGVSVAYERMFSIAAVTSAIMNTIPALVGHASAVGLLVKRGGLSPRNAGAVLVLDQVAEGLTKLAVLAIAVAVVGLPPWMIEPAVSVVFVVAILVFVVAAVAWRGNRWGKVSRPARLLAGIRADLEVMRAPRRAIGAIAVALAMKGAEALAIACVIVALGIDLPPASAFVVLGAVNLATMLPVAPGNIGTYEAGAVAAYRWMGVPSDAALAAALLQHACFLLPAVGAGIVALGRGPAAATRAGVGGRTH